jgi:hypothetical protein
LTEVEVRYDEYANGVHCDLVEQRLVARGYHEPFMHFDADGPDFLMPAVRNYLARPQPAAA